MLAVPPPGQTAPFVGATLPNTGASPDKFSSRLYPRGAFWLDPAQPSFSPPLLELRVCDPISSHLFFFIHSLTDHYPPPF